MRDFKDSVLFKELLKVRSEDELTEAFTLMLDTLTEEWQVDLEVEYLDQAIIWANTPQGHLYWEDIYNDWEKL